MASVGERRLGDGIRVPLSHRGTRSRLRICISSASPTPLGSVPLRRARHRSSQLPAADLAMQGLHALGGIGRTPPMATEGSSRADAASAGRSRSRHSLPDARTATPEAAPGKPSLRAWLSVAGSAAYRVSLRPLVAGIIGAGRSWTVWMISVLSIPRRYALVVPRSACWRSTVYSRGSLEKRGVRRSCSPPSRAVVRSRNPPSRA
jgi:hypothetical protein